MILYNVNYTRLYDVKDYIYNTIRHYTIIYKTIRDILLLESGFEPGLEPGLEPELESGLDQKNAKIRGIAITQWFCFIRHVTQAS